MLLSMYSLFIHTLLLAMILQAMIKLCNSVRSLSSSRGSLINVNVYSVTFGFELDPSRLESNITFPQTFCATKNKLFTKRSLRFVSF